MQIELPAKVQWILNRLYKNGYEGYAVGGCVRDSLMGRCPYDWDITTSASPLQVKRLFPSTFDSGIAHGTVTVVVDHENFEVTTYRVDGDYVDGRHPDYVSFTSNLEEDLKRRDFTINAMAYSDQKGLVDCFGGQEDLKNGVIRCVGDPMERFGEDALRIMRAVRFSAQLDFSIEEKTFEALKKLAGNLERISVERIFSELVKLITSPHPERIRTAYEAGITAVILPEFDRCMTEPQNNAHHIYTVGEHTIRTMEAIPADKILRLTMLLHDLGKPECAYLDEAGIYHHSGHAAIGARLAKKILRRLKSDRETQDKVCHLVELHSHYPRPTKADVRRSIHLLGEEDFPLFLLVKRADICGQNPAVREEKLALMDRVEQIYKEVLAQGDCLSLKTLAVTGKDLICEGIRPGPELGGILEELLEEVLEEPEKNRREYLLERAGQLKAGTEGEKE